MTLQPDTADGRRADVYSLGKTLWCLATGLPTPPAGEHRRELEWKRLSAWGVAHPRAFYLDRLIEQTCTEIPADRPPMAQVAEILTEWARAKSPVHSNAQGVVEVADVANAIADVLEGDRRQTERDQGRRAAVDAVVANFAAQVAAFIEQLDASGLRHSGITVAHDGVSRALEGFADEILGTDRVAAWRSIAVERNTGRDQRYGFLRSGVAAALATDQTVVLGAAHTITHAGGRETIWKGVSRVVLLGSMDLEQEMQRLVGGFLEAVPIVLEKYLQVIRGDAAPLIKPD